MTGRNPFTRTTTPQAAGWGQSPSGSRPPAPNRRPSMLALLLISVVVPFTVAAAVALVLLRRGDSTPVGSGGTPSSSLPGPGASTSLPAPTTSVAAVVPTVVETTTSTTTTALATTTTVAPTTTAPPPDPALILAQQYATALAVDDWNTVRALNPRKAHQSDASFQSSYGDLRASTILALRRDGNRWRLGLVAHEQNAAAYTRVFCVTWEIDPAVPSVIETGAASVRLRDNDPGWVTPTDYVPLLEASC